MWLSILTAQRMPVLYLFLNLGCSVALAQNLESQSEQPSLPCAHVNMQTLPAQLKLEKIRDVEHVIHQIYNNLGQGILCADPQWLEEQWGIRMYGWRLLRGLPETPIRRIDGVRVEPPPLHGHHVSWSPVYKSGQLVEIRVSLSTVIADEKAVVVPIEKLLEWFGPPAAKIPDHTEPPPAIPGERALNRGREGGWARLFIEWYPYPRIRIGISTGYKSGFDTISIRTLKQDRQK